MKFHSRAELEKMDSITLLWEEFHVAETIIETEKKIMKLREEVSTSSAELQEATRRRHTVVFPFEDETKGENPILKELRHNFIQKYEEVKKAENVLASILEYCNLIRGL